MELKLDTKTILIIILLGLTLLFGYRWFFESKGKIKQLEKEFKQLEDQKKLVDLEIISWRDKCDSLQIIDIKLQEEIGKQEMETKKAEAEAKKSSANLQKIKNEIQKTKKKIEEIEKSPPNRTGEDLLESLKNKTKK